MQGMANQSGPAARDTRPFLGTHGERWLHAWHLGRPRQAVGAVVGGDVVVSLCVDVASVRMMVMIKKLMMIMTIILIVINTN